MNLPDKKYQLIYADPPWKYDDPAVDGEGGGALRHYQTMAVDEICKIPVSSIAEDNSVLLLWTTFPQLEKTFDVIHAWGFSYVTLAFNWIKTYRNVNKLYMGMGRHTRSNSEICLLAKRGRGLPRVSCDIESTQYHPVGAHSRKPRAFRSDIERLYGNVSRIELFSRDRIYGWDVWGDQIPDTEQTRLNNMGNEWW